MTLSLNVAAPDSRRARYSVARRRAASAPTLTGELRARRHRDRRRARPRAARAATSAADATRRCISSGGDGGVQRVLLVGMGTAADRAGALRRAAAIAGAAGATGSASAELAFFAGALTTREAEAIGLGLIAGAWDFKELKTPPPAEEQRAPLDDGDDSRRRRGGGSSGVRAGARDRRRTLARAPARDAARQHLHARLSRRHGARYREAVRHDGHGARPRRDGAGEDGIVPLRRAGNAAGSEADRARVPRRPEGRQAGRARREGTLLRLAAASRSSRRRAWSG